MSFSHFSFDMILPDLNARHVETATDRLARDIGRMIGLPEKALAADLRTQIHDARADLDNGCLLFDVRAPNLIRPMAVLLRTPKGMMRDAAPGIPLDLFCVVVSPQSDGSLSLQRLARWTRLFKNEEFLKNLRQARDSDDIRILMSHPRTGVMAA